MRTGGKKRCRWWCPDIREWIGDLISSRLPGPFERTPKRTYDSILQEWFMSTVDLQAILERVDRLTPEEQAKVREALDAYDEQAALDEMDRRLLDAGLISEIPAKPTTPRTNPEPIIVSGKPVSETLIEERR
jgi:hypothetical protein